MGSCFFAAAHFPEDSLPFFHAAFFWERAFAFTRYLMGKRAFA
jgi:hypothetical protein